MSRAFEKRILRLPLIQRHHVRPAGRAPHEANTQERDEPQQAHASDAPIDRPFDPHIPLLGSIGGCTSILANTTLDNPCAIAYGCHEDKCARSCLFALIVNAIRHLVPQFPLRRDGTIPPYGIRTKTTSKRCCRAAWK
jgi:hypothetical protein